MSDQENAAIVVKILEQGAASIDYISDNTVVSTQHVKSALKLLQPHVAENRGVWSLVLNEPRWKGLDTPTRRDQTLIMRAFEPIVNYDERLLRAWQVLKPIHKGGVLKVFAEQAEIYVKSLQPNLPDHVLWANTLADAIDSATVNLRAAVSSFRDKK